MKDSNLFKIPCIFSATGCEAVKSSIGLTRKFLINLLKTFFNVFSFIIIGSPIYADF